MAKQILSIRLSADGLSFWTGDQAEGFDTPQIEISRSGEVVSADFTLTGSPIPVGETVREAVSLFRGNLDSRGMDMPLNKILYGDTLSTVLVPESLFRYEDTGKYLSMYGYDVTDGKYTVVSKPIRGVVAIMVLWQEYTRHLGECLGHFMVASPLQYNLCRLPSAASDSVKVYATPLHCFITVFSKGRHVYSEGHPLDSAADLIFYLDWLDARLGSGKWPTVIYGHRSDELAALAGKRFKGCVCG